MPQQETPDPCNNQVLYIPGAICIGLLTAGMSSNKGADPQQTGFASDDSKHE